VSALRDVRLPIVNIDSPIDPLAAKRAGVRIRTYVGTDDFAAGRLSGVRMTSLLHGGEVALPPSPSPLTAAFQHRRDDDAELEQHEHRDQLEQCGHEVGTRQEQCQSHNGDDRVAPVFA
jgi:hypothetical protein